MRRNPPYVLFMRNNNRKNYRFIMICWNFQRFVSVEIVTFPWDAVQQYIWNPDRKFPRLHKVGRSLLKRWTGLWSKHLLQVYRLRNREYFFFAVNIIHWNDREKQYSKTNSTPAKMCLTDTSISFRVFLFITLLLMSL